VGRGGVVPGGGILTHRPSKQKNRVSDGEEGKGGKRVEDWGWGLCEIGGKGNRTNFLGGTPSDYQIDKKTEAPIPAELSQGTKEGARTWMRLVDARQGRKRQVDRPEKDKSDKKLKKRTGSLKGFSPPCDEKRKFSKPNAGHQGKEISRS